MARSRHIIEYNKIYKRKFPVGSDSKSRLYNIWRGIHARCYNEAHPAFHNYGARGINVYSKWHQYENFRKWALSSGYDISLTLDRRNNHEGYCPRNCRWVTMRQQQHNRTNNIWVTAFGETKLLKDWSRDPRCNVSYASLWRRVSDGRPPEWAISAPTRADVRRSPMSAVTKAKIAARAKLSYARRARCVSTGQFL